MLSTSFQSPDILAIDANQLLLAIERALGASSDSASYITDGIVLPDDQFRIVRRVLIHLLGEDIRFSTRDLAAADAEQEHKLSLLYRSAKARKLYADAMGVEEAGVSPWHMHQFYARIAWLNESTVTGEAARAQLEHYVFKSLPFWGAAAVPGKSGYSALGELLTPIPEDLRLWMVQFKRGARLVPVAEWIGHCSAQSLYNGLTALHARESDGDMPDALSLFCDTLSDLIPTDRYHDRELSDWLNPLLATPAGWSDCIGVLTSVEHREPTLGGLQIDAGTHMSLPTRIEYLCKLAAYVVNPDNEHWLAPAIASAEQAPAMRALSLAIRLRFEHWNLAFGPAMMLASLLLMPALETSIEPDDALPTAHTLNSQVVPPLDTWSPMHTADYLFSQMGIELLCDSNEAGRTLRLSPQHTWHALTHTVQFQSAVAPLLEAMGWYGAHPGEQASPRITQALVGRSIIDFFLGAPEADGESLETFIRRGWVLDYSHVQLREKVRDLVRNRQPGASPSTVDLLHYLLLRETMAELLVDGVPDHLQYGRSLQSVALLHGVALVEAMTPGLAVITSYDELIKISAELAESEDPGVQALWATTLTLPAWRYATAHGAVECAASDDLQQASAAHLAQALSYLQTQQELHAQELNRLLAIKPPDRKALAAQMLTEADVPELSWEEPVSADHWSVLQNCGFTVAASYSIDHLTAVGQPQATVIQLVMMGEVYLSGTPTVAQAYATAFKTFSESLVSAETDVIKRLLSEAQPEVRAKLSGSTCEVSRVRFEAQEGVQGIFVRCQEGDHLNDFEGHSVKESFFELIPACGVVREVSQSFMYSVDGVTWSGPVSIPEALRRREAHQQRIEAARTTPLLPMDSDAYLTGTVSRSSTVPHTPLQGTLIPSAKLVYLPDTDEQTRIDTLAGNAATHLLARFLEQSNTEHSHETPWEHIWAKEREYADTAARFLIPFYGCIQDLRAGEHSAGVIVGCVLDAAFALVPLGQFAGATARIVMRAGELSVLSITRLAGKALGRLLAGLAEQSGLAVLRDLGKAGVKLSRLGWSALLHVSPSLKTVLSSRAVVESVFGFDKGMYRVLDSVERPWQPLRVASDSHAAVDGRPAVAVRNIGRPEAPDFRLLDPDYDRVFGKTLTPVSQGERLELSSISAADGTGPDRYPAVVPITSRADGFHEVRIDRASSVSSIERGEGEYDILVDGQVYHLDSGAPDAALRKRAVEKLSTASGTLEEVENLCRVRRDLEPVVCATGIRLATPVPEPVPAGSTAPTRTGKYPSQAMNAREFTLARLSTLANDESGIDVFVNEGKFCKWAEPDEVTATTSASSGKVVSPLSEQELAHLSLPETPKYLPALEGTLAQDGVLGLPANISHDDAVWIYQNIPVIEVGPLASGVNDARTLRGVRLQIGDKDWIFIEPDSGVFYKALTPAEGSSELGFARVEAADEINEFIRVSEQYRVFRERPNAVVDQENIARLLFDLLDESERAAWNLSWDKAIHSYDDYAQWCKANGEKNELLAIGRNVLSGEEIQKKFVDLVKASVPDFRKVAERSLPEQQHIVEVLNKLLPVQGSKAKWEALNLQSVVTPKAAKTVLGQIKGANLAFAHIHTESGERIVYYALSGGQRAKDLRLQLDMAEGSERVIDGVIFRDARARMAGREPDPTFTSLPVVRDANHLVVREFSRHVDSERLIATIIKQDMASTPLVHIKFFTVLDTCRSCGGFVLPRLKLDFPDALFSVTYMKNYAPG
ncbi:deaminase domain-containing protein [Pseudomonas viridiflava]|uniref:deaminase domain-containing protein n=1 Tax=Pseudomonas viridiflava TaxID=33069 RepID=UPI002EB57600|nr:deaminase domain-containing protein [Pseudomonas viridiflava]